MLAFCNSPFYIEHELDNQRSLQYHLIIMLSPFQETIIEAVDAGENVFMTGQGGVGKSHVIAVLKRTRECTVTALTGAAAVVIGGNTLHSALGIGIGRGTPNELARKSGKKFCDIKLLIIDEISMMSAELLDKIECVARIARKSEEPFGGLQIVLSGDFLQLPPIDGDFCFEAECWSRLNMTPFHMTESRRQSDPEFQQVLSRARLGETTPDDIAYLQDGGQDAKEKLKQGIIPTKLFCRNVDVDATNNRELAKLPADETFTYEMEIELKKDVQIKPELFCNAQKILTIAIGAQVMLIVNKDIESGLINGSRGVVTGIDQDTGTPIVKFMNGKEVTIDFHSWEISERNTLYGHIHAIPLKLAWAITCHKAQGSTIDSAYIDLNGTFEFGQAYVAISRVRSIDSLILKNASIHTFKAHDKALEFYRSL